MSKHHERVGRVSEPVQVYLSRTEAGQLNRLAVALDATKSDVLRRGLDALERQLSDPGQHPLERIMAMDADDMSPARYDVAREHDRFFAESELAATRPKRKRPARAR